MDKRKELLKLCGNMEQLAGVRRIEYQDGRASGLRCVLVENGVLEFPLMLAAVQGDEYELSLKARPSGEECL